MFWRSTAAFSESANIKYYRIINLLNITVFTNIFSIIHKNQATTLTFKIFRDYLELRDTHFGKTLRYTNRSARIKHGNHLLSPLRFLLFPHFPLAIAFFSLQLDA